MTDSADEQLNGRELDAAVAERVMGWWNRSGIWCEPPVGSIGSGTGWISYPVTGAAYQYAFSGREYGEHTAQTTYRAEAERRVFSPSESIEAAMQVEDRFADLGMQAAYVSMLGRFVHQDASAKGELLSQWHLVHASAEQRCRAALAAVGAKE
jgi:hypothetical protein